MWYYSPNLAMLPTFFTWLVYPQCRLISMPIVVGSYLFATFNSGSAYYDPALYHQVIGALLYHPFT